MKELEKNLEATGGVPAEAELAAINRFAKSPLRAEEVYTFSLRLCDNEVDRDWERFDTAALNTLGDLFVGKSGIFDHQWTAEGQTARIYRTEMVREGAQVTAVGDGYCWLSLSAADGEKRGSDRGDRGRHQAGGQRRVQRGPAGVLHLRRRGRHLPAHARAAVRGAAVLPGAAGSHRRIRVVLRGGASPAEGGGPEAVRPREPGDGTAEGPGGAGAEIPAGAAAGGDAAAEPGSGKNRGRDRISDLREDEA